MCTRDLFSLSTRMFRTRPMRTMLTILSISIGISAVLFLVALGYGLQNIILQKIVFNQALLSLSATPASELISFDRAAADRLRAIPHVTGVSPEASFPGQAVYGGLYGTTEVRAVNADYFGEAGVNLAAGKTFGPSDADQIVVSRAVLQLFGIADPQAALGRKVNVQVIATLPAPPAPAGSPPSGAPATQAVLLPHPFAIAGVVDDPQDSFVYVPLGELAKSVPADRFDQAQVEVDASGNLESVKQALLGQGYQVASLSETVDQANKIFQVIQIVLGAFGAVALIVSSIGMFNTMTVTLLERTNEIGIMRAIGASKANMKNLFLAESVVIGVLGGLVGELIGFALAWMTNVGINSLATHFGGAKIDLFYFPPAFLLGIIALSVTIGFLSGIFPARRAASLEPLEALRYK